MSADPRSFLALTLQLAAAGVCVQALETLWQWRELRDDRLLGWTGGECSVNSLRRMVGVVWSFPGCAWLLALRAALAVAAMVVAYGSTASCWVAGGLVFTQIAYNRRFTMLAGNSETMFLIGLAAAWVGTLRSESTRLSSAALLFLAAHALLAYFAAGLHKLGSRLWRSGAWLWQIARFGSYRFPALARKAVGTRARARVASWLVIALELSLPCALFLPAPIFWALLAAGLVFHTAVAVIMGLHGFWWAFAAAYPGIVFVHELAR